MCISWNQTVSILLLMMVGYLDMTRSNEHGCDFWYGCVFVGTTEGDIEFKLIASSNTIESEHLNGSHEWKLVRKQDNDIYVDFTEKVVIGEFQKDTIYDNNEEAVMKTIAQSLFGWNFYRRFNNSFESDVSNKETHGVRQLDWMNANLKEEQTWYPLPDWEDIVVLMDDRLKEMKEKRKSGKEKNDALIKEKENMIEEEKTLEKKQKELKGLKEKAEEKQEQHKKMMDKLSNSKSSCANVDKEMRSTKENVKRMIEKINEKKDKMKKELDDKRGRREEKEKEIEKRKKEKVAQMKEKDEKRKEKREKAATKKKTELKKEKGPSFIGQKSLANLLKYLFGRKTAIYQAYHGFFGKDLSKKKGTVYGIHQWFANFIRDLVGKDKVGLDE